MARVPDEAIRRRRELSAGAWHLYELYCLHRNTASGRCNPSNGTLAGEMRCSYTHISDCKTELVEKRWIKREGRQRVTLLIGEFPPLKVSEFAARSSENSEVQVRKIPKLGDAKFGKFRSSSSENSEVGPTPPAPPIRIEPAIEPEAAATAASAGEIQKDFRDQTADDAFVRSLIEAKLYPPDFVEFVFQKLRFRCAQEGVEPTKARFLYWLSTEREYVQPQFPSMAGANVVVQRDFSSNSKANPNLLTPKPDCQICSGKGLTGGHYCECEICPFCFSTGYENVDGISRVCRHKTTSAEVAEERSA